jgi:hypothetical protein
MNIRALWVGLALFAACGTSQDENTDEVDGGGNDGDNESEVETCEASVNVPWLTEGNFWTVSWSEIEYGIGLFSAGGDYDLGTYVMKLGQSETKGDITMFDLELSGDTVKYAPLWDAIGTDGCGTIYGSKNGSAPVKIYSLTEDEWSGSGFWTNFDQFDDIRVNRNASIVPSQYTKKLDVFEPPLTSIGYSDSQSGIGAGTGCEYFSGYGTICGSDDPGGSRRTLIFEYWDNDAGPVAVHYSYDYDSGGSLSTEQHAEQRVEVWFFGDTTEAPILFENEPDTYAEPTPFPISTELLVMFGEVNEFDMPSGNIAGYDPPEMAAQIHDWYAFEIDAELEGKDVDFYITWDHDVELGFYLFTAPDNPTYGFLYLDESMPFEEWTESKYARSFSGKYNQGKYLLGVIRTEENEIATQYGIFSMADPGE